MTTVILKSRVRNTEAQPLPWQYLLASCPNLQRWLQKGYMTKTIPYFAIITRADLERGVGYDFPSCASNRSPEDLSQQQNRLGTAILPEKLVQIPLPSDFEVAERSDDRIMCAWLCRPRTPLFVASNHRNLPFEIHIYGVACCHLNLLGVCNTRDLYLTRLSSVLRCSPSVPNMQREPHRQSLIGS